MVSCGVFLDTWSINAWMCFFPYVPNKVPLWSPRRNRRADTISLCRFLEFLVTVGPSRVREIQIVFIGSGTWCWQWVRIPRIFNSGLEVVTGVILSKRDQSQEELISLGCFIFLVDERLGYIHTPRIMDAWYGRVFIFLLGLGGV